MGKEIYMIVLTVACHFIFGVAAMDCIYSSSRGDINPLLKIPLILLGPMSFIVYIGIEVYKFIKSYIKEVSNYYKRKRRRRLEE